MNKGIKEKDLNIDEKKGKEGSFKSKTSKKMSVIKENKYQIEQDENYTPVSTKFFYENPD